MKSYKGWYNLKNADKFVKPLDEYMKSYADGKVNYKSRLELKCFRYCDINKYVKAWSLEPFAITYVKPTDCRIHRYYFDVFIEFASGDKFIVEVKSFAETQKPKPPKTPNKKSISLYNNRVVTYNINLAKWEAAKDYCARNGFKFIILTEKELK